MCYFIVTNFYYDLNIFVIVLLSELFQGNIIISILFLNVSFFNKGFLFFNLYSFRYENQNFIKNSVIQYCSGAVAFF